MGTAVYLGMAVTSHDNGLVEEGLFENVVVVGTSVAFDAGFADAALADQLSSDSTPSTDANAVSDAMVSDAMVSDSNLADVFAADAAGVLDAGVADQAANSDGSLDDLAVAKPASGCSCAAPSKLGNSWGLWLLVFGLILYVRRRGLARTNIRLSSSEL